jgi:hypothetical protein
MRRRGGSGKGLLFVLQFDVQHAHRAKVVQRLPRRLLVDLRERKANVD